jgi:hypothetical protein
LKIKKTFYKLITYIKIIYKEAKSGKVKAGYVRHNKQKINIYKKKKKAEAGYGETHGSG